MARLILFVMLSLAVALSGARAALAACCPPAHGAHATMHAISGDEAHGATHGPPSAPEHDAPSGHAGMAHCPALAAIADHDPMPPARPAPLRISPGADAVPVLFAMRPPAPPPRA